MAEKEAKKKEKRSTAFKRDLQNRKKRADNRVFKSRVRTAIRRFEEVVAKNEQESVAETLSVVYALMDKGVKKGLYKLNMASRTKSRLAAKAARAK
ncbi:30S ribosomal protein S20 [Waddlia chondrophila]|uniref:Small ribosomal subunit protein bS20 n=1 Tax=Waddlia chondrophila (strain ATCC VR-1470 / WSU 86-1044) TaxID=716544 RepID=D6YT81_WADCW|nr:30S ribosomal protein S20 [Waddlia chondrophila]ADI39276.1 30S ribosomal protein S20 [Waddlia chondrophila WSU 86-1044]